MVYKRGKLGIRNKNNDLVGVDVPLASLHWVYLIGWVGATWLFTADGSPTALVTCDYYLVITVGVALPRTIRHLGQHPEPLIHHLTTPKYKFPMSITNE